MQQHEASLNTLIKKNIVEDVQNVYQKINEVNGIMKQRKLTIVYSLMKYDEETYRVIVHEDQTMTKNLNLDDFLRDYK